MSGSTGCVVRGRETCTGMAHQTQYLDVLSVERSQFLTLLALLEAKL